MNAEMLSKRLETVVKYIPHGYKLADIGSDHAYLPCHAVRKGIVPNAIAGEVVDGPYQSAKKQVILEGLEDKISVRLGDGLAVISAGEVDCITICGMGGALISNILEQGQAKLTGVKRLVLQPNIGARAVRQWLYHHDWMLVTEEIVEEDGKIYEVLVAEPGEPQTGYEHLASGLLLGPYLLKEKSAVFTKKWRGEIANWQRILKQLDKAGETPQNLLKRQEITEKLQMVKGVLADEEN